MTSQPRRTYTNATIAGLMTLAGGACYWPDCGEPILRIVGSEPMLNVEIAHIRALEKGGCRFDPSWTVRERNSFVNLLLMCKPHHKTIDGPRSAEYPVELLEEWKHDREAEGLGALAGLREVTEASLQAMFTDFRDDLLTRMDQAAVTGTAILARLDARTDFPTGLSTLSPRARQSAQDLVDAWPAIEQAVGLLHSNRENRGALLRQWAGSLPGWAEQAPADAFGWLGQLASDYGAHQAAAVFFRRCIDEGGFPRDQWVALVAQQYMADEEDQEARAFLAANADPGSPLLLATTALCDSDWNATLRHVVSWQPDTETTRVLKAAVEATALTNTGQDDAALACLRAADPNGTLSGVQLAIAQILLGRADRRRGDQWLTEVQEAFSLAIKARDSRRSWFGDSVAPTVTAVQAAQACGDVATAWDLMQEQPEGQATPREARDARLLEYRALLAALTGRTAEARRLQSQIDSPYVKAQITALTLERESGEQEVSQLQAAWQAVWDTATAEQEQLHAAMGLAECGVEPAGLNALEAAYPDRVAEIRLIARASSSSATGDLTVLRANVTKSPMIVILLAQHYQVTGEREQRARTLRSGAEYWRDASLMAMAAKAYRQADMPGTTKECAREALELGGPDWPAQSKSEMYALLVETEFAEGNPDRAAAAARSMLTLNPHDHDALWALARCHAVRGMTEDAWKVLVDQGAPIEPRTEHEALLWVALGVRYSDDANFAGQALRGRSIGDSPQLSGFE
ncbi:tetratricopeptide repeat protein [Kitasatospora sp. NPDC047058]|uniref:tetratricopeptide repeat protein n=1 Tax=Kitasatospora sp. NPDC047058 TaxID=3155620 RepID=UPI0033CC597B